MRFSEFTYKRPDMNEVQDKMNGLIDRFEKAGSAGEQDKILLEIDEARKNFETMKNLAFINYSIDTTNSSYIEEQEFFDNNNPVYDGCINRFYKALAASKFRNELEQKYGAQIFGIAESVANIFKPEILEDLKKENALQSEYLKVKASAKINYDGKELNLQELEPYMESKDRETRKKAFEAYWNFFAENGDKLDDIFDKLVKLRDGMAKKAGFKNFVEMGYARMKRIDYNKDMVENFRKEVREYIVPIATEIRKKQQKRLGLDSLKIFDLSLMFDSGNANPKGEPDWIIQNGRKMYNELSKETGQFFDYMADSGLLEVMSKKGKADMGYCEFIYSYKAPFIFANMNGTSDDITVLTHEAGHAFQSYESSSQPLKEYVETTMETAEIHSMSMEFLTWKWMDLFFKEDTDKFKYMHLTGALMFLPYGVLVDEFQHKVYENPEMTPDERKKTWRELEKVYMPHLDYNGIEFLEKGGRWQRQGHIYEMPFYYIDYCLAQVCAFQFWKRSEENFSSAFDDYVKLCKAGGSRSFLQLVEYAGLESPFKIGTVKEVTEFVKERLDSIDDTKL